MISKIEENTIELAFCIDNNFAIHLCILLQSIKCNLSENVSVNCNILGELSNDSKSKLNELSDVFFNLTFYGNVDGVEELHISERYKDRLTIVTYYRLMLPKILLDKNKVIYLDADMIVLEDILNLWKINLNGFSTAVVEDFNLQKDKRDSLLNLKFNRYFNAGLLVMDLDAWRKNNLADKSIINIKSNPDYEYNDQDGLNVILDGDCCFLEEKWNAQTPVLSNNERNIRPKIVHFTGQEKPWHISCQHPNTEDYRLYKKQTPYVNAPLEYFLDSEDLRLLEQLTVKFPSGCGVAIYGCGNRGRRIIDYILDKLCDYEISFVVDKSGDNTYRELPIFTIYPQQNIDVLLIASIPFRDDIIASLPKNIIKSETVII